MTDDKIQRRNLAAAALRDAAAAMHRAAHEMLWLDDREADQHAAEMVGAALLAESWAGVLEVAA